MAAFRPSAARVALIVAVAFVAFLFGGERSPAHAASFTVNSTADTVDANPGDGVCAAASGQCTLRAAIMEANALSGADTITLPAGTYKLTITGAGEDAAATGDLDITSDLTIAGAGAATTIIDGSGLDRIFDILSGTVSISGVTIQNGWVDSGGGVNVHYSPGTLTLESVVIRNNTAAGFGGGIDNAGSLKLRDATVSGNSAGTAGGGISNFNGGTAAIDNSTFEGNNAMFGGGAQHSGPQTVTITNSTFSGNTARQFSGGINIFGTGTIVVNNSTVTNNTGDSDHDGSGGGGGIGAGAGTLRIGNTIVAGNHDPNGDPDCYGTISSTGFNLVQTVSTNCHVTGQTGSNIAGQNPLLGPLASNGGPTQTHALLPGSPAIDAGSPNCPPPATDQRGIARAQGPACDIGAYEAPATASTPTPTPTLAVTPTPSPTPTGAPALKQGDVDCSGTIDSVDALGVLRFVAQLPPAASCIDAGDVDCNNGKDSVDALDILRFVALLPFTPPAGCTPIGQPL